MATITHHPGGSTTIVVPVGVTGTVTIAVLTSVFHTLSPMDIQDMVHAATRVDRGRVRRKAR